MHFFIHSMLMPILNNLSAIQASSLYPLYPLLFAKLLRKLDYFLMRL